MLPSQKNIWLSTNKNKKIKSPQPKGWGEGARGMGERMRGPRRRGPGGGRKRPREANSALKEHALE